MRTILQCSAFSCLIRMTLIVWGLHLPANSSRAQHEVFDKSVIQKWKDYEVFSRNLQGTQQWTGATSGGKTRTDLLRYKQNQECALVIVPGRNPGEELCGLANPSYSARIKRSTSDASNVILIKYDPRLSPGTDLDIRTPIDGAFLGTSPHFSYALTRLSQLVLRPSFKVTKVASESHNGQELIRVDHTYTYNVPGSKNDQQERISGSLYFDALRCWCLRRFKKSVEVMFRGERNSNLECEVEFETIDHPSGFPIVKSQTVHTIQFNYKSKQKSDTTSRADYDLEVKEGPPDSEFTLTAFGLPEPGSDEVKKPTPLYVWILVAAAVSVGLAVGFFFLARRSRAKPAV